MDYTSRKEWDAQERRINKETQLYSKPTPQLTKIIPAGELINLAKKKYDPVFAKINFLFMTNPEERFFILEQSEFPNLPLNKQFIIDELKEAGYDVKYSTPLERLEIRA